MKGNLSKSEIVMLEKESKMILKDELRSYSNQDFKDLGFTSKQDFINFVKVNKLFPRIDIDEFDYYLYLISDIKRTNKFNQKDISQYIPYYYIADKIELVCTTEISLSMKLFPRVHGFSVTIFREMLLFTDFSSRFAVERHFLCVGFQWSSLLNHDLTVFLL